MGILGITNRTENWKTVQYFHGLSDDGKVCLVEKLGEPAGTPAAEIKVELFWKGVRDYAAAADKPTPEKMAEIYNRHFADLRQQIGDFREMQPPNRRFRPLQVHNYVASPETQNELYQNLQNTEIDIVLETPKRLFIGEAKHESRLNAKSDYVLVHQLVREYVTARILVDHISESNPSKKREVVLFIVGNNRDDLKKIEQVKFMLDQEGWLEGKNILSWDDIAAIKG